MTFVFLRGQLGFMKSRGMDVHVLSAPGPEVEEFRTREGVAAHTVPMERRITPLGDFRALWRILGIFRRLKPDIVHASTPKGGLLGTIAARLAGTPLVLYHVRGLAYDGESGIKRFLLQSTERVACALAHRVLCVSESVKIQLANDRVANAAKMSVLLNGSSNGVDAVGRFNPTLVGDQDRSELRTSLNIPASAQVIGFVGRLVRDKGVDTLANAFEIVAAGNPNAHLLVVGGWEARDPVDQATRDRLLNHPRVRLTGSHADPSKLYAVMDVFALPTLREGFPNVALEASAMQLPVVASRVTGCVDAVIDGVTGRLIEPRDPVQLADALSFYLDEPALREQHGKSGRVRVLEKFQPEAIWQALYKSYGALP
ncbi:MAG: glycosyltransferase family 4 protein [Gemmatimonadaceae bacterium]|nr:glycosyltransferase family 4 protein [Gemmatimonadaceae bacterium]